jgi:predicted phosphodiesterase
MTLLIGIVADSHGRPGPIQDALALLKKLPCRIIYHLGDVCDSTHLETAEACLRLLQDHQVLMIKGNNDHAILANYTDRPIPFTAREVWRYLQAAPLIRFYANAVFTHSLPFAETMGLSSMIGAMGENEALLTFKKFPRQLIFRGHSHSPEIFQPQGRGVSSRSPVQREKIDLAEAMPCVVTCGALTRGWYMVWNPLENSIQSLSLA